MSTSFKSHENLLSSRAMDRSDRILEEIGSLDFRDPRRRGCIYGTNDNGEAYERHTSVRVEKQLLKNLVVFGIGHIFVFSAFTALQSLQSSLFLETGLGLKALCILYSCAVISGFYGTAFVQKFTPNWTMVLAIVIVGLFVSAFFYPRLYSLVPTAVALGLTFGPFFISQLSFVMQLVSRMSYLTADIREKVQQRYLRLFFFFTTSSRVWGHLIASILIHYGGDIYVFFIGSPYHIFHGMNPRFPVNDINMPPSPYATIARPNLCALEKMTDDSIFRRPTSYVFILPLNLTLMLISVFLGMTFLGVAVATTLLDKCEMYTSAHDAIRCSFVRCFRKTIVSFVDNQLWLLLLVTFFMGLQQGFIHADFTRSYVSCALGIEPITYTMMAMGATNTAAALSVHLFTKHIRRTTLMAVGAVCQAGLLMVLWLWTPVKDDLAVFYIIATGWGLCHGIWETLITTHIATTYVDDWQAPFSSYFISHWIGLAVSFGWSSVFVTDIKIYILAGVLTIVVALYSLVELRNHQRRKEQGRVVEL